jgi:hypothetical protein
MPHYGPPTEEKTGRNQRPYGPAQKVPGVLDTSEANTAPKGSSKRKISAGMIPGVSRESFARSANLASRDGMRMPVPRRDSVKLPKGAALEVQKGDRHEE